MPLPTAPGFGPRDPSPLYRERNDGGQAEREIDLRELSRGIIRHRWLVVGIAAAVIGLGGLFTWLQTPEYEGETTIHVEQSSGRSSVVGSLGDAGGLGALAGMGSGSISTEIAVLRSRSIADAVVDSLNLRVQVIEPEMPRDELLEVVKAPRAETKGVYELTRIGDGRYNIRPEDDSPVPHPGTVAMGQSAKLAATTIRLRGTPIGSEPERIRIEILPFRVAVERVQDGLQVAQVNGGAQVLSLRMRHPDPILAAAIPNAVARSYVQYKTLANTSAAGSSVQFLQEQVDRYSDDLAEAESRLQRYSEDEQIVSLPEQASAQVRHVADLRARRDMQITERESLREILAEADAESGDPGEPSPYRRLATFPTFLSNGIVQNLVSTLIELETERSELLGRFTPQHPDVARINERIDELESQLHQIGVNYVESLNSQISSMNAMLTRFGGELESVPARQVDYARLVREQAMLEEIYTLLETRLTEARIREAGEPVDVRVLDAALVPDDPVSPRPLLALLLSGLTGLILGLGVASVRSIIDPRVRSRRDVLTAASGAPVIGTIPRMAIPPQSNGARRLGRDAGKQLAVADRSESADPHLVTFHNPNSPAAEAYRGLRTSITLLEPEHTPRVLVATSAMPGEGKSVSASNLAVALAQQGTRTLLIDADLRQSGLHRLFRIGREPGLTDLLLGRADLEEVMREVAVSQHGVPLHVLVAGAAPPHPSELLGSARMQDLLGRLRDEYEIVILDAPPLQLVTDAAVLGAFADSTLLIARAGTTHKRLLAEAVAELHRLNISVGGVVVNDLDADEMGAYRYGYEAVETG